MAAGGAFRRLTSARWWGGPALLLLAVGFAAPALAAPDRDITVTWRAPQDSTKRVKLAIECRTDCSVEITGKLEIPRAVDPATGEVTKRRTATLKPQSDEIDAKSKQRFKVRIPRKARPSLENAFAADETALARLKVRHFDDAGGSGRVRAKIELGELP